MRVVVLMFGTMPMHYRFLFPDLERSMRDLEYEYNQNEIGEMQFRLMLPKGRKRNHFRACVDGQFGGITKVYRDWKICGDDEWLKKLWPAVKKSLEYTWSKDNADMWDINKSGVIHGRQHHTLDVELFGANSWLTGFYLVALKAAAEMAQYLGEEKEAEEYLDVFARGQRYVEENLFNGSYYIQEIDLKDKGILEKYCGNDEKGINSYWNCETEEIKYQYKDGCIIDQVLAQWHSNLCGLGDIFDKVNRKKAIASVYENNFKSMRDIYNPCRVYAMNDEKGIVICEWPDKNKKPLIPIPYTEEVMTGFEYSTACLMLQEGLEKEALEVVKAVRDRYDGEKRNPWSEIECGSNYARSMASYSFLLTMSGFKYDMCRNYIGFEPMIKGNDSLYRTFWSINGAWGIFEILNGTVMLQVLFGELNLNEFSCSTFGGNVNRIFNSSTGEIGFEIKENLVIFEKPILLKQKDILMFS